MLDEALAPLTDGVAVTAHLAGNVLIGRAVRSGGAQDDAAAEDEGLGRGAGADEGFELGLGLGL